ncbi:hypothetical protein cypCar_00036356 [Cyprinus carpio]|nr:hypothetical protein cypCar_00036356 [Cyprinus carpio]
MYAVFSLSRVVCFYSQDVEFCGYSITHPSESKINFRIQTRDGVAASEPLRSGLNNLTEVCKHVLHTFEVCPVARDLKYSN